MSRPSNLGILSRVSAGLMLLGFALVPALAVFHYLGWALAGTVVVLELLGIGLLVRHWLVQRGQSLGTFLRTPVESSFDVHPLIVAAASVAGFLIPGIWIIVAAHVAAIDPDAMTVAEQRSFGVIFCLMGAGLSGLSVTKWLERSQK